MDKEKILEKIERWKLLANSFIKKNTPAFIKEDNGDLHFCYIILNGDDSITIDNFGPEQRKGKRDRLYWLLIQDFDKYNEVEDEKEKV